MANGTSGTKSGGGVVNQLQPYGNDSYKAPFPFPENMEEANEIAFFNFRMGKYANVGKVKDMDLPVEEVSLSKLSKGQDDLSKKAMDNLMKLPISQIQNIKDNETSVDMPYVIKYKNTYQIQDGHHRLSALWAKGAKKAKVKVLDLEKIVK